MRKFTLIILLIISYYDNGYSQSGWVWNNPKPQGIELSEVDFINMQTGYAFGEGGLILKTTNGGHNWDIRTNGDGNSIIKSVNVVSENIMYAIIDNSVKKSTNGGISWDVVFYSGVTYGISGIKFLSSNEGFGVGSNANFNGIIIKTTNGGQSWDTLLSIPSSHIFSNIYFATPQIVFAYGNQDIYKSTNGGTNWYEVDIPSSAFFMTNMYFPNPTTGYVKDFVNHSNHLYKTTNGGENWFYVGDIYSFCNSLIFKDANTGYASDGDLIKTTNGGLNWDLVETGEYFTNYIEIVGNKYITVGLAGDILQTTDGFNTYTPLSQKFTSNRLYGSSFINVNTGYCIAQRKIFKTENSGLNWSKIHEVSDNSDTSFSKIYFLDSNTGLISGSQSTLVRTKLWRTTNGGTNWSPVYYDSIPHKNIVKIIFNQDHSVGFAVGQAIVLKTTNQGLTWVEKTPQPEEILDHYSGVTIRGNDIMITGTKYIGLNRSPKVFHSTDGGNTWNSFQVTQTAYLNDVKFLNQNTGYITGYDNTILKTTNGGFEPNSWFSITPSFASDDIYFDINFVDANTGYIIGQSGTLIKTTNGGASWDEQISDERIQISSASIIDYNTGFLFGSSGMVLKTTTGGTIGITNISLETPSSFGLHQNYPNPFNPTTKIRFNVPNNKEFVKLVIYDITGREIIRLVNQELSPGIYEYEFNGRGLSSGMYFYKLEAGDFLETRKMVLVK